MKFYSYMRLLPALLLGVAATACSDSDTPEVPAENAKETALREASVKYINNTVLPTYKGMADNAVDLYDLCETMSTKHAAGTLTEADIKAAGEAWKASRRYWELSEAFLFGPAADHNIDPHIDSWPLDKDAMDNVLAQLRAGASLTLENNFNYGLLGFHSLEYMLFELSADGRTSKVHSANYTPEEMAYLLMVAEDLRNQCVCLEACWAGTSNVSTEKQEILEEAELDLGKQHGWMMMNAGQAGSIYKTYQEVAEEIIQGCIDIADEVGNTKIGRPNSGSTLEDRNYIESPYSLNSIEDFQDNIRSIKNSYLGSVAGDASISDYIKTVDPALDAEVRAAIDDAIAAIALIPEPFALNATGAQADAAIVKCNDLVDILEKVSSALAK